MGWSSGSQIFEKIITAAIVAIPDEASREAFYVPIIKAFDEHDWDTHSECEGTDPAFDNVLRRMYPDWYREESDAE